MASAVVIFVLENMRENAYLSENIGFTLTRIQAPSFFIFFYE